MKICAQKLKKPYNRLDRGILFTELPPRMKEKNRVVRCVFSDEQIRQTQQKEELLMTGLDGVEEK